jgi:hypothetical protein
MTISAAIAFVQGALSSAPGVALIGNYGTTLTGSNGNNTNVVSWQWTIVDVPPGSAVPLGPFAATPTASFVPDLNGGYLVQLTVTDGLGNTATDFRCFQVPETSGRIIPPFKGTDASLNFIISAVMNLRGWAPFMTAYCKEVDLLALGGGSSSNYQPVAAPGPGTFTLAPYTTREANCTGGAVVLNIAPLTSGQWARMRIIGNPGTNSVTVNYPSGTGLEYPLGVGTGPDTYATSIVFNQVGEEGMVIEWYCPPTGTQLRVGLS